MRFFNLSIFALAENSAAEFLETAELEPESIEGGGWQNWATS